MSCWRIQQPRIYSSGKKMRPIHTLQVHINTPSRAPRGKSHTKIVRFIKTHRGLNPQCPTKTPTSPPNTAECENQFKRLSPAMQPVPRTAWHQIARANAAVLQVVRYRTINNAHRPPKQNQEAHNFFSDIKAPLLFYHHIHRIKPVHGERYTQSHCANTHHLALRSARTRPRHTPFSPILITVSQTLPSAPSAVPPMCSLFRNKRIILPDGV